MVESIELKENKIEEYEEKYYEITATDSQDKISLKINAINGQMMAFDNMDLLEKEENNKEITDKEVINVVDDIYGKVNLDTSNYELDECNEEDISYRGKEKNVWNVTYYKKYNGIINPYERLIFYLIVNQNEVKVCSIYTDQNGVYEDNPQVITEQEAIEIAKNKEKEITENAIIDVKAELGIRKQNSYIFELEQNASKDNNEKETNKNSTININENLIRNVWIISIKHENYDNESIEDYLRGVSKQYYVDKTTGEIIGGNELKNY